MIIDIYNYGMFKEGLDREETLAYLLMVREHSLNIIGIDEMLKDLYNYCQHFPILSNAQIGFDRREINNFVKFYFVIKEE